jgi:2-polyprenyl-3-methyl-5-hydroxy-6-metoxy-1,4-benzoquinol methylase
MLKVERLDGKSFLDIGSGSGLFSLAARRLGARVHSFDYDQQSVACTAELRRRYFPSAGDWVVERGSALDRDYLARLGTFDVVYSWGVLHHTGDMWRALENVKPLVAERGTALHCHLQRPRRSHRSLGGRKASLQRAAASAFIALRNRCAGRRGVERRA